MKTTHELSPDAYSCTARHYDTQDKGEYVRKIGAFAGGDTRPEFLDEPQIPPSQQGEEHEPA